MRVLSIGGGPAGLYFAILLKKALPSASVRVAERNRFDDTFGWGVVFSAETLENFRQADPETFAAIEASFARWDDIETHVRGAVERSTGHGFCGLSRKRLLLILQARARELGVELEFQREIADFERARAEHDLVLGADGVQSAVRARYADAFRPEIDLRRARFCWLGTTLPLAAFTFVFAEGEHGLFQVHAYPFEAGRDGRDGLSTWIVETHEDTWKRAGLDRADEVATVAYCEALFAPWLRGHRLLTNKSVWRQFPTVRCASWRHENVALAGDAAHTAHFSIGSGTKLAMEDAIALAAAVARHAGRGAPGVRAALEEYESERRVECLKLQRAAQTSLEWFENSRRYLAQAPVQFNFNLMTRSKRITYENLRRRDPALVARTDEWFAESAGAARGGRSERPALPPALAPFELRALRLANRIVVSPMCQYSAVEGVPNDWHLVHLGSRAVGGAGLVMAEMTNVERDGRITRGCTGIWNDEQAAAWKRVVDFVHASSAAKIGLQLGHAGRKGSCSLPWEGDAPLRSGGWPCDAPSALAHGPGWAVPRELDAAGLERVRRAYARAAALALAAGFDLLELHMAHGYLLSSFLTPLANRRADAYGGSLERRLRFPLEVFDAVRAAWPAERPIAVRLTATDWLDGEGGQTLDDAVQIARALARHGCDLVDVSSGGNDPRSQPEYGRMYQVPFAERIKAEAGIAVMAVGGIAGADHANTVIAAGRADLVAIARGHLLDPYIALRLAGERGAAGFAWPRQYLPARPNPRSG
jgi:anthraniloyl-CoA monooxygenase